MHGSLTGRRPRVSSQWDAGRRDEYAAAMQYRRGGITWFVGTLAALVGVGVVLAPHSGFDFFGGLLVIGGIMLRIEAAVLRLGSGRDETDDKPPERPWHRTE